MGDTTGKYPVQHHTAPVYIVGANSTDHFNCLWSPAVVLVTMATTRYKWRKSIHYSIVYS